MPAALEVPWREIRSAVEGGLKVEEVAARYDISATTVRVRAHREGWATVAKVTKLMQLQVKRSETDAPKAAQLVAQSLVERQEEHREIVHRMMRKALKNAEKAPPSIENMTDLEKAVKIHRLTLDMSTGEAGAVQVNLWSGGASVSQGSTERVIDVENVTSETEEWV
jgi:transposase-like protein